MDPREHSDAALLSETHRLLGSERALVATLVAYLAEIEERRLHLTEGFSSMFDFCTRGLGLSENEAFRRIAAARLGRRFPLVHALLASGAVHLTTLELLREHLTDENHEGLLAAASHKTKRELEALLATRFPRPDPPARIRQLSSERFQVEFTADRELRDKLELCRDLLSHANPTRDLAVVIERAVDLLLSDLERTRLKRTKRLRAASHVSANEPLTPARIGTESRAGATEPLTPVQPRAASHANTEPLTPVPLRAASHANTEALTRVTSATRRAVFDRDGLQCTYVSREGRRCEARAFLELDHVEARALGGSHDVKNLRVRCRSHNQLAAEQAFGREMMERGRYFGRTKRRYAATPDTSSPVSSKPSATASTKLLLALTGLGFGRTQARKALSELELLHPTEFPPLELALREAILIATRSSWHSRRVA